MIEQTVYDEYHSERTNEEPFEMYQKKWQFCNAKNSKGKIDIGVYCFQEDRVYNYLYWREAMNLN
jgi:hypothetical protein